MIAETIKVSQKEKKKKSQQRNVQIVAGKMEPRKDMHLVCRLQVGRKKSDFYFQVLYL